MAEVTELIEILKEGENKPITNVKDRLHFAVVNSLWAIVTGTLNQHQYKKFILFYFIFLGKRHKQNDVALLEMTKHANEYVQLFKYAGANYIVDILL